MDDFDRFAGNRVAVLGHGVTALILALRFAQAGRTVTLVGRSNPQSRSRPLTLRAGDRNAMRMLDELGLVDEVGWTRRVKAFGGFWARTEGLVLDGHSRLAHVLCDRLTALGVSFRPTIEALDVDEVVAAPLAVNDLETAVVLATSAYRARCADKIA